MLPGNLNYVQDGKKPVATKSGNYKLCPSPKTFPLKKPENTSAENLPQAANSLRFSLTDDECLRKFPGDEFLVGKKERQTY